MMDMQELVNHVKRNIEIVTIKKRGEEHMIKVPKGALD